MSIFCTALCIRRRKILRTECFYEIVTVLAAKRNGNEDTGSSEVIKESIGKCVGRSAVQKLLKFVLFVAVV
jgi:hypothetical protein